MGKVPNNLFQFQSSIAMALAMISEGLRQHLFASLQMPPLTRAYYFEACRQKTSMPRIIIYSVRDGCPRIGTRYSLYIFSLVKSLQEEG